jgi:hypothetical protein
VKGSDEVVEFGLVIGVDDHGLADEAVLEGASFHRV